MDFTGWIGPLKLKLNAQRARVLRSGINIRAQFIRWFIVTYVMIFFYQIFNIVNDVPNAVIV
jgi:hypothetical protein